MRLIILFIRQVRIVRGGMKRIAMKAILAVLAGVFGVGTAAAQSDGGTSPFDQLLAEIIAKVGANLPPEANRVLLDLLSSIGLI